MTYPKVAKSGLAVPTGPTGILSSSRGGAKSGGTRTMGHRGGLARPRGSRLHKRGR